MPQIIMRNLSKKIIAILQSEHRIKLDKILFSFCAHQNEINSINGSQTIVEENILIYLVFILSIIYFTNLFSNLA